MSVFVRWYNKVVEGSIVNEHDLFGMVAVSIPIQGVQATALFTPQHVYKTLQDACGNYPKHFPTPKELVYPEPPVKATVPALRSALRPVPATSVVGVSGVSGSAGVSPEYLALQQFKHDHWDTTKNMLQLAYWPEFDRLYHAYQRKRHEMKQPKKLQKTMNIEHPFTPQEAILPMAKPEPPVKARPLRPVPAPSVAGVSVRPVPATSVAGPKKKITITELSLFD